MSERSTCDRALNLSVLPSRRTRQWVSTYSTQNAFGHNHVLDLLELYASQNGIQRDDELPNWRPTASFAHRLRKLGAEFRRQVTGAFARRVGFDHLLCVPSDSSCLSTSERNECTKNAMQSGVKMITGAVLADERARVFARVPILLRADVADNIFNLGLQDVSEEQPHLYVAVGIKRRSVETKGSAIIRNTCLEKLQKEMFLWNLLLSQTQPVDVGTALIIGLHPKRKQAVATGAVPHKPVATGNNQASAAVFNKKVWKLAVLPMQQMKEHTRLSALEALRWRIDVVDQGNAWLMDAVRRLSTSETSNPTATVEGAHDVNPVFALLRTTSDPRLRPNMKCASMFDWPWENAKKQLAHDLRELTLVSGVSRSATAEAMAKGIPNDYSHHQVTAEALGSNSMFTAETLQKSKPGYTGPVVTPRIIPHNKANWRLLQDFSQQYPHRFSKSGEMLPNIDKRSFYVDLELASAEYMYADENTKQSNDADSDLVRKYGEAFDVYPKSPLVVDTIPDSLVYMIGCGQIVDGAWKHKVFITDTLDKQGEQNVIMAWLQHMQAVTSTLKEPSLVHVWGPEKQLLSQAFRRMPQGLIRDIEPLRNYVIMDVHKIVATSGVSIRGSLNNSIKNVAKALQNLGLLDGCEGRDAEQGVENGADAIAAVLYAAELVHKNEAPSLSEDEMVQNVARYNEHDCRDVARIVAYLRKNH
ncbi:hypothetical protein FGB62_223g025 [Gracilaria domingensis]|nr:hypothetical protein FGB62_223g025 [Gracilaria domingensis]